MLTPTPGHTALLTSALICPNCPHLGALAGPHHRGHFSPPLPLASNLIVSRKTPCPAGGVRSPGHGLIKLPWNDDTQSVFSSCLPCQLAGSVWASASALRTRQSGVPRGRRRRSLLIWAALFGRALANPGRAPALLPGLPAALARASYLPALTLERLSSTQRSCLLPKPLQFLSSRQRQTADGLI